MIRFTSFSDEDARRYPRVYVVQCHETGRIKIGQSNSPWMRAQGIAAAAPTKCTVEFVIDAGPTLCGKALERSLHRRYADERVRGEWFAIAPWKVACDVLSAFDRSAA